MEHLVLLAFLCAGLLPCAKGANLDSDKKILLDFSASLPHPRKVNWSLTTQVCTSWVGVTCTPDGKRVRMLRLPAVGLFGPMPSNILGKLDALEVISLRANRLSAGIPPDVASIPHLHSLYLQRNNLSGRIPTSLASKLVFVDLSYNSLSGPIPDLHLPKLRYLNFSFNNLTGPIPASLQKFPASSFSGNAFLCGLPLEPCPGATPPSPSPPTHHDSWPKQHKPFLVLIGVILLLGLIVATILVLCCFKRKGGGDPEEAERNKPRASSSKGKGRAEYSSGIQEGEMNKLVGCSYDFDYEDLLRASGEVLGKGSYGPTYKAGLEDGTTVVVKRLMEVLAGKKEFEQQMQIIGRLGQHQGFVPLRAFYYSKNEKLLIYDYVPLGSLSAALHGKKSAGRALLDWETRVKISLGAARAIAHLHTEGGGKFIHGNIKSSNVLLSRDFSPHVSDFGLAQLMAPPQFHPQLIGYHAPEVRQAKKPTQKSDVYSFGVLLLEMLTGKDPLRSPGRDGYVGHLPMWVLDVVREEWTSEVFAEDMQRQPNTENERVQLLKVAMACVGAPYPDERPTMEEVVRRIEEIRSSGSGSGSRTTTRTCPEDKPREEHIQIT